MMETNKDYVRIKDDLAALGIRKGDDVIVHSAYKQLGGVEGGIETVIAALASVLGDCGTLLFPTLSYQFVNPEPPVNNNVFDVLSTPSCVGAMPNVFMKLDGVERSLHPTHSVAALGARQNEYIKNHELDNEPVGPNSPFFKLKEFGGKVLFLGAIGASLCYLVAALSPFAIVGLLACALTGFFVSMMWPGSLIIVQERVPNGGVLIFALMASGGDMGAAVGPQLVGVVTDLVTTNANMIDLAYTLGLTVEQLGMKVGLLLGSLFPILAVVVYSYLVKSKEKIKLLNEKTI